MTLETLNTYRSDAYPSLGTLNHALQYAQELATASKDPALLMTAVHVVLNTAIYVANIKPTPLTHDQCLEASHLMALTGGSFASTIADAYMVADGMNAAILRTSFAPLFASYVKDSE